MTPFFKEWIAETQKEIDDLNALIKAKKVYVSKYQIRCWCIQKKRLKNKIQELIDIAKRQTP